MTTSDLILEVLRWIRQHRTYDGQDNYFIDADEFENWLLGLDLESEELHPSPTFHFVDVPVVDGVATLPDGTTVRSDANVVRVPVLGEPPDADA